MFTMEISHLKNQMDPWCNFMSFSKISAGSIAGIELKVFRGEILSAHVFACCGTDNVFLLLCHLQAQRLSGIGIHLFFSWTRYTCSWESKVQLSVYLAQIQYKAKSLNSSFPLSDGWDAQVRRDIEVRAAKTCASVSAMDR